MDATRTKILLVEDEKITAIFESTLLKRAGYDVVCAETGEQALSMVGQDTDIDLILMDIDLGAGMDGTEAAGSILASHDIPLVFLSSHTEPEIVDKTEKINSYGYVVKDSGETVLLASIRMAFKLHRTQRDLKTKQAELARALAQQQEAEALIIQQKMDLERANEDLQATNEELHATNEEFEAANEELVQSQHDLLASEKKFKSIVEYSPRGLHLYELNKKDQLIFTGGNAAADSILGISHDALIGKTIEEAFPPLIETEVPSTYREVARSGITWSTEQINYDDGKITGAFEVLAFRTSPGTVVASFTDITERKKIEEALKTSEERFRTMFTNMKSGIAVYEPVNDGEDFIFRDFNPAAETISRIGRDRVIGRRLLDLFPNMDRFGLFASLQRVFRTGKAEHLEAAYYRDSDREGYRENYIFKLPSGEVIALYDDITERITLEQNLRREKDLIARIMEIAPMGVTVLNTRGQITFANAIAEQILGMTRNDITSKTYNSPQWKITDFNGNVFPEAELPFVRVMETGEALYDVRHAIETSDRQRVFLKINASPLKNKSGDIEAVVVALDDVTGETMADNALRKALDEREALFRELQHRIKNNLSIIISIIHLEAQQVRSTEARAALERISARISSLAQLYTMLSLSRDPATINLGMYIQSLAESLKSIYLSGGERISLALDADSISIGFKAAVSLGIIFTELLTNAFKYAYPGDSRGTISISLKNDRQRIVMRLSDNGVGFSEKNGQDEQSLGLRLVQALTGQIGASIHIQHGNGTTATIILPAHHPQGQ
jgi:PAS domain S-box-containing protein